MCNFKPVSPSAVGVFCAFVAVAVPARADLTGKALYQRTLRATALVQTRDGHGTGWLVDHAQRLLITNYHVVRDQKSVTAVFPEFTDGRLVAERSFYQSNGLRVRGTVRATDPSRDLALIELESVPANVTALALAAHSPTPSDRVHAIGNPGVSDALWIYSSGTVRQVYRRRLKSSDFEVDARVIETQTPTNPGDSGGPVVNDAGELIGVTKGYHSQASLVSYCIDVSEVRQFLADRNRLQTKRPASGPARGSKTLSSKPGAVRSADVITPAVERVP